MAQSNLQFPTTLWRASVFMLNTLRERRDNESGFTLIELLVVILIIGILAAIALPAFLGQQTKGQDSDAKSNARNAAVQVESCFQDNQSYTSCTDAVALTPNNLPAGTGSKSGKVHVDPTTPSGGYTITAESKSGNTFVITKSAAGTTARTCSVLSGGNSGGCGASWNTGT